MNGNPKLTPETRDHLVSVYVKQGWKASAEECARLGVGKNHAYECWLVTLRPKKCRVDIGLARDRFDPRWAWAIQRGPIIA